MNETGDYNPVPGIRAVLVAGFMSGNVLGWLYLAVTGHLLESLSLNPVALGGAFLGVGLVGMWVGAVSGLSLRLLLGERTASDGWYAPIIVAGAASGGMGLLIASFVVGVLW
jgi:hypothetical protein